MAVGNCTKRKKTTENGGAIIFIYSFIIKSRRIKNKKLSRESVQLFITTYLSKSPTRRQAQN
jgi:hypothetical protein